MYPVVASVQNPQGGTSLLWPFSPAPLEDYGNDEEGVSQQGVGDDSWKHKWRETMGPQEQRQIVDTFDET